MADRLFDKLWKLPAIVGFLLYFILTPVFVVLLTIEILEEWGK